MVPRTANGSSLEGHDQTCWCMHLALCLWTFGLLESSHRLVWQSARGGYYTCAVQMSIIMSYIWFLAKFYESLYLTVQIEECRMNSSAFIPKEGLGSSPEEIHSLRGLSGFMLGHLAPWKDFALVLYTHGQPGCPRPCAALSFFHDPHVKCRK